jgi:multidrug efflux pump subunit AcrB
MLGILALTGMIIRNSVILVDQVQTEVAHGLDPWNAVIEATMHRFRPILLTASAAILGMIPIAPTVFWGPMAYAIMGGLAVATVLTLIFLPALYVAWFRISPERGPEGARHRPREAGDEGAHTSPAGATAGAAAAAGSA